MKSPPSRQWHLWKFLPLLLLLLILLLLLQLQLLRPARQPHRAQPPLVRRATKNA